MLDDERTQFEQVVEQDKVHLPLNDEEIIVAEVNEAGLDSVAYMEAPALEFENASTWAGVNSPSMLYTVASQPAGVNNKTIYLPKKKIMSCC